MPSWKTLCAVFARNVPTTAQPFIDTRYLRVYTLASMRQERQILYSFRVDQRLLDGLRRIAQETGVTVSEQLRRLIVTWLEHHEVAVPEDARTVSGQISRTARKRKGTSKRR
jgi:hypothetical protein